MRGILIYRLPQEQSEFDMARKATKWALTVWDLDQMLRSKLKYGLAAGDGPDLTGKSAEDALEWVREMVYEVCDKNGVSLDDIE